MPTMVQLAYFLYMIYFIMSNQIKNTVRRFVMMKKIKKRERIVQNTKLSRQDYFSFIKRRGKLTGINEMRSTSIIPNNHTITFQIGSNHIFG